MALGVEEQGASDMISKRQNAMAYMYCARSEIESGQYDKAANNIAVGLVFLGQLMGDDAAQAEVSRLKRTISRLRKRCTELTQKSKKRRR